MPGGDRTGPAGMGPMTGRAAGYCAGYTTPGFANPVGGYGFGRRFGCGMGLGFRGGRGGFSPGMPYVFPAPYAPPAMTGVQEVELLQQQAENLKTTLDQIQKRISDLEKNTTE